MTNNETHTDLSQASIAAALEAAAGVAVKAASTARYNLGKAMTPQDAQSWGELAQEADQIRDAIRALITDCDRDALAAHVAAEVAKARAEDAELIAASLSLKEIVEGVSGAMEHGTFRAEKGMRLKDTPEWVAFYVALAQIGAKP